MSAPALPLTGGCQCGAVRFSATAAPVSLLLCHCRMCQKAHAAPAVAFATLPVDAFSWTRGTPATFRSSDVATGSFCADCGTPLAYRHDREDTLDVATSAFDAPADLPPDRACGVEAKMPWFDGLSALPGKDAGDCLTSRQHPDRETGDDWPAKA